MRLPRISLSPVAIASAIVIAFVVNVLAARHYKRWDWTKGQRYSLSPATIETLHGLGDTVDMWVILGPREPLEQSVKQLLESYDAETKKLAVHYVDPDRDTLALIELQKRFNLEADRSEDGKITTDAIIVVAHGDKRTFLTVADMIEPVSGDDPRAKPREEQAITGAIRTVTRSGDKARLCFTSGHNELGLLPPRDERSTWIGELKTVLERDMYTLHEVDTTDPNAHEPFKECDVVVVAGPSSPFSDAETNRLKTFLLEGGSALIAVDPVPGDTPTGLTSSGLGDALAPFGIGLDERLVIELDPALSLDEKTGTRFFVDAKIHPVSQSLVVVNAAQRPPKISLRYASPLRHVAPDAAAPATDVLATSESSYAVANVHGVLQWTSPPKKEPDDPQGPIVVAMASERPKTHKSASHGPRVFVLGSSSPLARFNFAEPRPLRGATILVESALSWLASRPAVLDVPERPAVSVGARLSPSDVSEVLRYVLLYMPLAAALLGLAVFLRRRSTEGAPRAKAKPREGEK